MRKLALFGLAALLIVSTINIIPAAAEDPSMEGKIVKRAGETTLYYIGIDGNRYIFPNEKTYKSWFVDFSDVEEVSDEELSEYPLVGNIRYRPGVLLIKIQTDPKVYAVSKNGVLRWIRNERLAKKLYGDFWSQLVEDVSAAFFTNYSVGEDINEDGDFDPDQEIVESETIDKNRGIGKKLGRLRGRRASSARAKIAVCHKGHTIVVGSPAVPAHLAHGDTEGRCGEEEGEGDELAIDNIQKATTDTTATITWDTNIDSNSKVEYATETLDTAESIEMESDEENVNNHSLELTELTLDTLYYFKITSVDEDDNTVMSEEMTFTTNDEPDETPPIISDIQVVNITSTCATINWSTDEPADGLVSSGTESPLISGDPTAPNAEDVTEHSIELCNLTPNTLYYYLVHSTDAADNSATSEEKSFVTQEAENDDELVAFYSFEGNAEDSTDNNNDGVVTGPTSTTGIIGSAYQFNGIEGERIRVPDDTSLDFSNAFTLAGWFNFGDDIGSARLIAKEGVFGWSYRLLTLDNGAFGFSDGLLIQINGVDINGTHISASTGFFDGELQLKNYKNQWVHIASTFDASTLDLFINGNRVSSAASSVVSIHDKNTGLGIGAAADGRFPFDGRIDEVKLFNYVLTDNEIEDLAELP